jgi:site-specific DNA-methyltransferase (adenine-specific)
MIIFGDCFEKMKDIADKSVDLILTDPPYGLHNIEWDGNINMVELWRHYERLIRPDGNILIFASGLFAHRLALSNTKMYRYDLVWKKSKCGSPLTCRYMPAKKHEYILVFGRPAAKYNPQMEKGKAYRRKWTPSRNNNLNFGISGVEQENSGTRHPSSVLDFPQKWSRQQQALLHPTLKPVELCEWLVKSYSNEGDTVLDSFCGSGTTCVAAKNTGRKYIGIENNSLYFERAVNRLRE